MRKQFTNLIILAALSTALVGCGNTSKEPVPSVESTTDVSTDASTAPEETPAEDVVAENAETITDENALKEESQEEESQEVTKEPTPSNPTKEPAKDVTTTKPSTSTKPDANKAPVTNKPATKPSSPSNNSSTNKPTTNKPSTNKPSTNKPSTNKPSTPTTPAPEVKPTPSEPTAPEETSLSCSEIFSQITKDIELAKLTDVDATLLSDLYGMDTSLLEDYYVKMPMMSFQITEIGVFKVKDVNNLDKVVASLNKRASDIGQMLYPSLQETFDSRVLVTSGNYILFAIDENAAQISANFSNIVK